jgi:hypothetical protein
VKLKLWLLMAGSPRPRGDQTVGCPPKSRVGLTSAARSRNRSPRLALFVSSCLLFVAVCSTASAAGPIEEGKISQFYVHQNPASPANGLRSGQRFIVRLDGTVSDNTCTSKTWTGFLDTDAGRAQYSALVAASMSGRSVKLQGTDPNVCESGNIVVRNVYLVW